jgi:putative ABC transport system permease protein
MYMVLLFLALLAVFDTQVLAIFKRRKEIGTLIALGMTRSQVVKLFTLEGAMHGVLAALVGALYGTPLIYLFAKTGMDFTEVAEAYGMGYIAMLYPVYSAGLVIGTVFIVMLTVTVVSFIPSRKIATLDPTKALKGKVS